MAKWCVLAQICAAFLIVGACADSEPDPAPGGQDPTPDPMPDADPQPDPMPTMMPGMDPMPEMNPDPMPETPTCAEIPGCEPGNPDDYDFDQPASAVVSVLIESDVDQGEDQDGDGTVDNNLGAFLAELVRIVEVFDVNAQYADTIADGRMAFGALWPGLPEGDLMDVEDVEIHFLPLTDADGNPDNPELFRSLGRGFIDGSKTPVVRFEGARIEGGVLSAGPGTFALPFPVGAVILEVEIDQARIKGSVRRDGAGVVLDDVELSGIFRVASLIDALNDYLMSQECACAQVDAPLLSADMGCLMEVPEAECRGEDEVCGLLAATCGLLGEILTRNADVDLDGDGRGEALSLLLRLDAVGTRIDGVVR